MKLIAPMIEEAPARWSRDDDVVELVVVGEERVARLHQIVAHDDGEEAADQPGADREDDIERADILVIGRGEPARPESRHMIVPGLMTVTIAAMRVNIGRHRFRPREYLS
jgi:hypothetical protein